MNEVKVHVRFDRMGSMIVKDMESDNEVYIQSQDEIAELLDIMGLDESEGDIVDDPGFFV